MNEMQNVDSITDNVEEIETFKFQAEITQLMSIIINTLYSNKSIFLRELISNSSDALDKLRYMSLTDPDVLKSEQKLAINIIPDKDNSVLHIEDTGIGMTKADLINNLGTIAKSGTKGFIEQLSKKNDMSLIGQFGVGFYSAFLVANTVTVTTKHNDDEQYTWSSTADGSFTIKLDTTQTLKRGTRITLYLKEDQKDYVKDNIIKHLVRTHSEFINYPISLANLKQREIDVIVENNEEEDVEGVVKDEEQQTTEKRTETYSEYEELNSIKPLWTRDRNNITNDEYTNFYKAISGDKEPPLAVKHFKTEGEIEFKAIMYIPRYTNVDVVNKRKQKQIKLYVRRIFITDHCEELVPDWLSFIVGIIDSEDLPLNISREMLQKSNIMKSIRKHIIKKSIELFTEVMSDDYTYKIFYKQFSRNIKLGIHEDQSLNNKLGKLLRYKSAKTNDEISLDDYITNMKPNQNEIYYIGGESIEILKNSSIVEGVTSKGYNVLFMTDPIDEYVVRSLNKYNNKVLQLITNESFVLPLSKEEEVENKKIQLEHDVLCNKMVHILNGRCSRVIVSTKLNNSPCSVFTNDDSWSINMERIMKTQSLSNNPEQFYMVSEKNLEINPNHPIIKQLKYNLETDNINDLNTNIVNLMYDSALIEGGITLENKLFSQRIYNMIEMGLGTSNKNKMSNSDALELSNINDTIGEEEIHKTRDKGSKMIEKVIKEIEQEPDDIIENDKPILLEEVNVQSEEEVKLDDPVLDEPVSVEPVLDEIDEIVETVLDEPVSVEPVLDEIDEIVETVLDEPVLDEPVLDEPVLVEPVLDEPVSVEPVLDEPVSVEPVSDEPVLDEPDEIVEPDELVVPDELVEPDELVVPDEIVEPVSVEPIDLVEPDEIVEPIDLVEPIEQKKECNDSDTDFYLHP